MSSRQYFLHDPARHIRQTVIPSLEAVGEAFVVESELVQDRGVEIAHVDLVAAHVEAEAVALAIDRAGLEAATGLPQGEDVRVAVPAYRCP